MVYKLPRWVWLGATVLSFAGGVVNSVALLGFSQDTVTHVTGNVTKLAIGLEKHQWALALHFFLVIFFFFVGSVVAGYIIQDTQLRFGRRYGVALLLESGLLLVAMLQLEMHKMSGVYLLGVASGLQNGMATTYSGAVVRTTHLTGMITDLGTLMGHFLRGLPISKRRALLYGIILLSFGAGCAVGTVAFAHIAYRALWLPALLTGVSGAGYLLFRFYSPATFQV